jgi:hypothetical protein
LAGRWPSSWPPGPHSSSCGVGLTQWVGRVIAGETFVSMVALGMGIVLAMVRFD